jgi:hypothetical protein
MAYRWDRALPDNIPEAVKIVYNATWETTINLAEEASAIKGRDRHPYFKKEVQRAF